MPSPLADRVILAIDPGVSGAWARYDGKLDKIFHGTYDKREDLISMSCAIEQSPNPVTDVYLELVHSSPQMGVRSAFTFGQNFGRWEMLCHQSAYHVHLVRPPVWMKAMIPNHVRAMTSKTARKNKMKEMAQETFPSIKMTLANCDAFLILDYGMHQHLENPNTTTQ